MKGTDLGYLLLVYAFTVSSSLKLTVQHPVDGTEHIMSYSGYHGVGDVSLHVQVLSECEADQSLIAQLGEKGLVCASIDENECIPAHPSLDSAVCIPLNSGEDLTLRNVSQGLQYISVSLLLEQESRGLQNVRSTCNMKGNVFELPSMLDIGLKVNSDKVSHHGYHRYYAPALSSLRNSPVRLLEIGLLGGGSLKLWKAFFPQAAIVGVDNGYQTGQLMEGALCDDLQCVLEVGGFDMKVYMGDQANETFLQAIVQGEAPFDIIIDDGGHTFQQQQVSFKHLFPLLKPGGLYVIEDVETSYWHLDGDFAIGGIHSPRSTVNYFRDLVHEVNGEFSGRKSAVSMESIQFGHNWIGVKKRSFESQQWFSNREYRFSHRRQHAGAFTHEDLRHEVCHMPAEATRNTDADALELYTDLCRMQTNCTKTLQYDWIGTGLGAAMHFLSIAFAFAHGDGRALVPASASSTNSDISPYFQGKSSTCRPSSGMSCFFKRMSLCEVVAPAPPTPLQVGEVFRGSPQHSVENRSFTYAEYERAQMEHAAASGSGKWEMQWWVPPKFRHRGPLWYRSHVLNFLLKPSAMLAQAIANTREGLGLRDDERCIAMYVRRGDKVNDVGMPNADYLPITDFVEAAESIRRTHEPGLKTIVLSTEDAAVISEVEARFQGKFRFVYTSDHKRYAAKNRESLLSLLQQGNAENDGFTESMIAWRNLFLAVDCQYYVGTLSSNWGRLILEIMYARLGSLPIYKSLDHDWIA